MTRAREEDPLVRPPSREPPTPGETEVDRDLRYIRNQWARIIRKIAAHHPVAAAVFEHSWPASLEPGQSERPVLTVRIAGPDRLMTAEAHGSSWVHSLQWLVYIHTRVEVEVRYATAPRAI
jgi:hypothetical protein